MPMGVVLAVVGLLVLAVLVLVAAVYLLDSHAEQQRQRLQDLMRGSASVVFSSLQHHDKSQHESPKERNREAPSQPCHICGSLRNRRSHGLDSSPLDASQLGSFHLATPWRQLLAAREKFTANTKHGFECLTGLQRGSSQLTTDLRKWLVKERIPLKERAFDDTQENAMRSDLSCGSKGCSRSIISPVATDVNSGGIRDGDVGVNSFPTVEDPIGSMVLTPKAGAAFPVGLTLSSSSLPSSDCTSNSEIPKSAPLRRLVLEILMSPSDEGAEIQSSRSSSTSGVRLKFETNASMEHSANSDLAFEIKEDAVEHLCMPVDAMQLAFEESDRNRISGERDVDTSIWSAINGSFFSGSVLPQKSDTSFHMSDRKIVCSLPDVGVPGFELPSIDERLGMSLNADIGAGTREVNNRRVKQGAVVPISASLSGKKGTVRESPSHVSMASILGSVSEVTTLKDATSNAKVKLRILTPPVCSISQNLASVSILDSMAGQQHSLHSEYGQGQASFVSLEGLGSLRLAFLKADTESKVSETCSMEANAEIAAALSTLRVDSGCTKVAGTRGGLASVGTSGEIMKNSCNVESSCANTSSLKGINEGIRGEGSESDHCVDEGEVHVVLSVSKCTRCEGDEFDAKKREKKKKKNRGRRQKGKVVTSVADGQERQEIGKIALEVAKHVSAVPETEIGCICGTPKGGLHSNSCPYPFTSSGSMLQRKIKEQYDELVQSNAAKTLTLAQVGRFTTCLVEAKAALQQKSDMIQRRFTIAKSLLTKADKSSFDRLCGQIYGLEAEQKKLEEDTVVYNRLQEQLKLSPAYQKMLEYGRTHFELQPHTGQMIEKLKAEDVELSFEELLAQEKKDGFWQKHGLSRSSVKVS